MGINIEEFYFKSSNNMNDIYAKILIPTESEKINGVILFCHGMCEYFDKYSEFYNFMIKNKYIVCGYDAIGHGLSIKNKSDLGFFSEKDGYKFLIEDVNKMVQIIKNRFHNLPLYLIGHSMGSLILRCYISKYNKDINGLILCGTVGPQMLIDSAISLADAIIKRKGERYRSRKLNKILQDFANMGFEPTSNKFDWTTSDKVLAKKNENDEKQNFIFTASAFKDLFELVKLANLEKGVKKVPKDLPIYFMSGAKDPVGENGIGVKRALKLYEMSNIKNVSLKLYDNCRHEILGEVNRVDVYNDILEFIDLIRFGDE